MPIYVYEPTVYSTEEQVHSCCFFEILQNISEPALKHCPTCGHNIHKAITGFYVKEQARPTQQKNPFELVDKAGTQQKSAKNAAQLAARHICGRGCAH